MTSFTDLNKPLFLSYCNKYKSTGGYEKTERLIKTLENNRWEYNILATPEEWKGFDFRMKTYKDYLETLDPNKIVIVGDAHDVYCVRSPTQFIRLFKEKNKKILVSTQLTGGGKVKFRPAKNCYQTTPLYGYFNYHKISIDYINNTSVKKYVNAGLIAGKASDLIHFYKWALENKYTDDQKALGAYMNSFPQNVFADFEDELLHTSEYAVNFGLNSKRQISDSPSILELCGFKAFFLHIPGYDISKGQKYVYDNTYKLLEMFNPNIPKTLYPQYDFENFHTYYE